MTSGGICQAARKILESGVEGTKEKNWRGMGSKYLVKKDFTKFQVNLLNDTVDKLIQKHGDRWSH